MQFLVFAALAVLGLVGVLTSAWLSQDISILAIYYPIIAWGSMILMAVMAVVLKANLYRLPYILRLPELDLSAAAYLIMGYGFVSMLSSMAISLGIILDGKDLGIAEIPIGQVVPVFVKGMISMAIGYGISSIMNFLQNWSESSSFGGTVGAGGAGGGGHPHIAAAATALHKELTDATKSMAEFNALLSGVAALLKSLNDFFPASK